MTQTQPTVVVRQLELKPDTAKRLDKLRQDAGMQSDTEVLRRALQIFEGLVADRAAGKRFFVRDAQGNETEITV